MICTKNQFQESIINFLTQLEDKLIGEELWILVALAGLVLISVYVLFVNTNSSNDITLKWEGLIFFTLVIFVILVGQFPNFARYNVHINECQHIAEANKLISNSLFWKDVDGTTIGPIPIYLLSILGHLDLPIDYFSAKVLNVFFWIVIILLLYNALKIEFGVRIAKYSIVPLVVFVTLFSDRDFVAYNGEVTTLMLESLALCMLLFLIHLGGRNFVLNFILGVILILMPFSKIQIGPVAVFIGIFYLLWLIKRKAGAKYVVTLLSGVILPLLILIYYLYYFDIWDDFKESYILNNLFYASKGEGLSHNKGLVVNIVKFIFILFRGIELRLFFSVFIILIIYHIFINWVEYDIKDWITKLLSNWFKIFLFGFILISSIIVYLPGNVFLHYALFLIPPVILIIGYLLRKTFQSSNNRVAGLFFLIVCVIGPSLIISFEGQPFFSERKKMIDCEGQKEMASYLCSVGLNGDKLAIWGWESCLYSDTGLIMATRESQTQRQILSWKQKDYYMQRYMKDIKDSRPRFFIDSTLKNSWIFRHNLHNYKNYPELAAYIQSNYKLVVELDNMKLFERRSN